MARACDVGSPPVWGRHRSERHSGRSPSRPAVPRHLLLGGLLALVLLLTVANAQTEESLAGDRGECNQQQRCIRAVTSATCDVSQLGKLKRYGGICSSCYSLPLAAWHTPSKLCLPPTAFCAASLKARIALHCYQWMPADSSVGGPVCAAHHFHARAAVPVTQSSRGALLPPQTPPCCVACSRAWRAPTLRVLLSLQQRGGWRSSCMTRCMRPSPPRAPRRSCLS